MSPYLIFSVLLVLFLLSAPVYSLFHTKKKPFKVNVRGIPRPRIMPTVAAIWLVLVGVFAGALIYAGVSQETNGGTAELSTPLVIAGQLEWMIPALTVVVVWWAIRRSPERFPSLVVRIAFFGASRESILVKRGWNFAPQVSALPALPRDYGGFVPPQHGQQYPPAA